MGFWRKWRRMFGAGATPPEGVLVKLAARGASPQDLFLEYVEEIAAKLPHIARFARSETEPLLARAWIVGHAKPSELNLDYLFQETRELGPDARSRAVTRFLKALTRDRDDPSWDEALTRFVPVIRLASFGGGEGSPVVQRPFLPFLRLFVGLDRDDSTSFVMAEQLRAWQQAPEVVFSLSLETFAGRVSAADVERYDADASSGFWHVTADDSYQPSRLALPGYLASFRGRVAGNPIAILPDRARLIIAGDGEPDLVGRLARMAQAEFEASARPISCAVYTVDPQGSLQPLHLPTGHPHQALVERGHRLLARTGYAQQKEQLEQRFEVDLTPLYVASLGLFVDQDSGYTNSWASLAQGVDALLPEADLIAISGGAENAKWFLWVPWDTFFELAPGCLELASEYDPARWRTKAWPSEVQLSALRAVAKRPAIEARRSKVH